MCNKLPDLESTREYKQEENKEKKRGRRRQEIPDKKEYLKSSKITCFIPPLISYLYPS